MSDDKNFVPRAEFVKLENVVAGMANSLKDLADIVNKKNSISIEETKPEKRYAKPNPFELKGVGKVQFKFPKVEIRLTEGEPLVLVIGEELAKDAELASRVYKIAPDLFTILK